MHSQPGIRALCLRALVVTLSLLGMAALQAGGASGREGKSDAKASARDRSSPMLVPGEGWVRVEGGQIPNHAWGVFLYPQGERPGNRQVCLVAQTASVGIFVGDSVINGPASCHSTSARGFWRMSTGFGVGPTLHILAFVFARGAQSVELVRSSGTSRVVRPSKVDGGKSKRIGVKGLTVLTVQEPLAGCYTHLRVFGRHGQQIGATSLAPCELS